MSFNCDPFSSTTSFDLPMTFKFNGKNYNLWAKSFEIFLKAKGLGSHLIEDKPNSSDPNLGTWEQHDAQTIYYMLSSIEPHIGANLIHLNYAKDIWNRLKQLYSRTGDVSRIYEVGKQFFSLDQGNQSLEEYFSKVKRICDELNMYQPLTCDVQRMQQQREDFNVIRFLTGLSPEYEPIRAQILDGPSLPSLTDVFRRLQRATQSNGASGVHNDNGGDSSTLTVSQGGPNSFRRGRGREPLRCTHCGRPNHTVNYCWDLHGRPKLSGYANQVSNNEDATSSPAPLTCSPQAAESDMITITRDEYDQLMSQQQPLSSSSMVFFAQSGSQDEEEDWYVRQGR